MPEEKQITDGQGLDWLEAKFQWAQKHWLLIVMVMGSLGAGNQCSNLQNHLLTGSKLDRMDTVTVQRSHKLDSLIVLIKAFRDTSNAHEARIEFVVNRIAIRTGTFKGIQHDLNPRQDETLFPDNNRHGHSGITPAMFKAVAKEDTFYKAGGLTAADRQETLKERLEYIPHYSREN